MNISIDLSTIQNERIRRLAERSVENLVSAFAEQESEIISAIHQMTDQRDDEKDLKFKASFGISFNLDKSMVETGFAFSVKHQTKALVSMDKQAAPPELPFDED